MSWLLNLKVFLICFPCCFSQDSKHIHNQTNPVEDRDFDNKEILFRIVQGTPAKLGDVPYQVAFRRRIISNIYQTFCGGSILGDMKIVSAAHCFYNNYNTDCFKQGEISMLQLAAIMAVAGTLTNFDYYQIQDSTDHGQWRALSYAFYPPQYRFPKYDIAVVFVKSPFVFNAYVNMIPLASVRKDYSSICVISGYGRVSEFKDSPILYHAKVPTMSTAACSKFHLLEMRQYVCIPGDTSNVQKGDSGGPLVCKGTGDPQEGPRGILVGVVSGMRMTLRGPGSFFTRTSSYKKYIDKYTSSSSRVNISIWSFILINGVFILF